MCKIANLGYDNERNSKTKYQFDMIFGTDAKKMCVCLQNCVSGVLILFFKFELRRKIS